jgi:peptidoglycan/LPS O-acetylase OafA/YrhL
VPAERPLYRPQLDGLRGIAVLLVLIGHLAQFRFSAGGVWENAGAAGVLLFFVLSGYLITDILIVELASTGAIDFRAFYIRRALRLLPALFVFVGAMAILKVNGQLPDESWTSVLASLFYVRNIFGRGDALSHLWSLSMEEQFYLSWPLLLVLMGRKRLRLTMLLLGLMAAWRAFAVLLPLTNAANGGFYMRPWFRYDSILYGALVAILLNRRPEKVASPVVRWLTHPLLTMPMLLASANIPMTSAAFPYSLTIQSVFAFAIIWNAVISLPVSAVHRVLSSSVLRWLGKLSYALYLWQQPFFVVRTPAWAGLRSFPLNVAVVVGLAIASQYLVERPFLALKARFPSGRRAHPSSAPATAEPVQTPAVL